MNPSRKIRDQANLKVGQPVQVTVRKDTSPYGMPMPEELDELLRIDDEGNQRFHALTPGKQRSILHFVASGSSVQVRIDRAISMIDRLKL